MNVSDQLEKILYNISSLVSGLSSYNDINDLKNLVEKFRNIFLEIEEDLKNVIVDELKKESVSEIKREDQEDNGHNDSSKDMSPILCEVEMTESRDSHLTQFGPLDELNMMDHNKDDYLACPDANCDFVHQTKDDLYSHVEKIHNKSSLYTCLHCDKIFFSPSRLNKHMGSSHQVKHDNLTCLWCNKKFETIKRATGHMRSQHSILRRVECDICNKEFDNKQAMETHIKFMHTGKKPKYTCHICGKEFTNQTNFKIHEIRHMKKSEDIECKECDRKYVCELELNLHISRCHKPKNFLCTQCDFATQLKDRLKVHMESHSEERPFLCSLCSFKGKSDAKLKSHVRKVHCEERKYICKFCGKAFKTNQNLKSHVRIHTGELEAHCHICGKGFAQKYNYTLHMIKTHGISC